MPSTSQLEWSAAVITAAAFLVAALRPLVTTWVHRQRRERDRSERESRDRVRAKSVLVAVLVLAVALGLAIYAAAASYESVSGLAGHYHVPLHRWYPLSLDGGLIGVTLMNLALLWMGQPLWWLRWIARLFAFGTIAANALAGWPSPAGVMLRVWPSVLFVVVVEAAQAVLMRHLKCKRQAEQPKRKERDRIPLARWFLARRSTFELWKRMKLWRIKSYSVAVRTELSRQQSVVRLAEHYAPGDWREQAPQDLVWMLETGVRIDEALARVGKLITDAGKVEAAERAAAEAQERAAEAVQNAVEVTERTALLEAELTAAKAELGALRKGGPVSRAKRSQTGGPRPHVTAPDDDLALEARALELLAGDLTMSGAELGRRLGVTPGYGRKLRRRLTEQDRLRDEVQDRSQERDEDRAQRPAEG